MKILPIKPQNNCCASPNKTQVFDLKQDCTNHSVRDIKVLRERLESISEMFVLMSNKSCCFSFLLKQCCCCKVIQLELCCWVLKQVRFFFSSLSLCIYRISLSTLFKCGWMATHRCVLTLSELCEITTTLLLWGWVGVLNIYIIYISIYSFVVLTF